MKPKNRTAWQCPICGRRMTKAGRVGHMRWKHGRDHAAPLLSVEKPYPVTEARRKAKKWDNLFSELRWKVVHEPIGRCPDCHKLFYLTDHYPELAVPELDGIAYCEACDAFYQPSMAVDKALLAENKPCILVSWHRMPETWVHKVS